MEFELLRQIFENYSNIKSMKICPVGAELFHADGQTDNTKLIIAFRNFSNAPKKRLASQWEPPVSPTLRIFLCYLQFCSFVSLGRPWGCIICKPTIYHRLLRQTTRMRRTGHVPRTAEIRNEYRSLVGKLEWKRESATPRARWQNNNTNWSLRNKTWGYELDISVSESPSGCLF
jgi:hypothetical protein